MEVSVLRARRRGMDVLDLVVVWFGVIVGFLTALEFLEFFVVLELLVLLVFLVVPWISWWSAIPLISP